jgi:hypothetical protein
VCGKTHKVLKYVTDTVDFDKYVIPCIIKEFYVREKTLATICELHQKLRDRINFKGGSTSLRNIMKEFGFLWKKTRNNRVALIEKHDARFLQIIIFCAGGHCGFILNMLFVFSHVYCGQMLNFLFEITACKHYHHLQRKYTSNPVFFA